MDKKQLKKLYNLHQEIGRVEKSIFNKEFYEGNGFVWFEKLRNCFNEVYKEFDSQEYSQLEYLGMIVDDGLETFDFDKLTSKDKKKLTCKEGYLSILHGDKKNYPYCIIKFKDIDEVIDYILST